MNLDRINLDEEARTRLKKYKKQIDTIRNPHSSFTKRRKVIQRGGFLTVSISAMFDINTAEYKWRYGLETFVHSGAIIK